MLYQTSLNKDCWFVYSSCRQLSLWFYSKLRKVRFPRGYGTLHLKYQTRVGKSFVLLIQSLPRYAANFTSFSARLTTELCIFKVATEILKNRRDELQGGKSVFDDDDKVSMLTRLLKYRYPSGEPIPDEDIISECTAHVYVFNLGVCHVCWFRPHSIAGSDTSATTISYILWEISRRPDIALRLQSELDMFMPDGRKLPDIQVLQNLPYLNAVLKEGMYGLAFSQVRVPLTLL